jgi:hypothetical protein
MGCFTLLLLVPGFVLVMLTLLRWFEQITEAVEQAWWNKVIVLALVPFAVWFFPGRVAAGRPTPVPLHEPVRGFGLPKSAEPKVEQPPKKAKPARGGVDPDKMAKLRQKMREQGMLGPDE